MSTDTHKVQAMVTINQKIKVQVKEVGGIKRWNHLFLSVDGQTKEIFLIFDTEDADVFIQYETVGIITGNGVEEHELSHEEEEAVINYISSNYGGF